MNVKSTYLFLCNKEETPRKPKRNWYDGNIQKLPPSWYKHSEATKESNSDLHSWKDVTLWLCSKQNIVLSELGWQESFS
jgi:hypothetical protein